MRDASATFLSNLFARPDIHGMGILKDYLEWSLHSLH